MNTGFTSRRHVFALSTFVAFTFAIAALFALPSSAGAFGISNLNHSNTSTQAAGHPDVTISFNRTGGENEDLKDIRLDLPTGVFANPESVVPKCSEAQFNSDSCPAHSQVGTVDTTVKALGLLSLDIHGTVDLIAPANDQVATLGLTLRPEAICILFVFCAQPQKIFLKTGVNIRTYENSGLRTYTPGAPRSAVIGIPLVFVTPTITGPITINRMALTFQARSGTATTTESCSGWGWWRSCTTTTTPPSGPYFWTQTGSCLPATTEVEAVSYKGQTASASTTYQPTGCENVPFDPSVAFSVADSQAGASTEPTFTLSIPEADAPIQHSLPKIVDVDFAPGSGINLNALTGVVGCTEAQLQAEACPAESIIGNAEAFSKYLPPEVGSGPGLVGNVYAMGVGNEVPIGVQLIGPRETVVIFRGTLGTRGDANDGTGRVYALFDRIPQLPFSEFTLNITKDLYKNPANTCGTNTLNAEITGFNGTTATGGNGTVVDRTADYEVTGCAVAPETTITNGPPSLTTNRQPAISFESSIPGSTFQCKYDAEAYAPCTSPLTPAPLSDGSHTFSVFASNGLTDDPTPATYTFTVATGASYDIDATISPSTSQATAHPDMGVNVDITGGQPKSFSIKFARGFSASLSAVPLCQVADSLAGTCPAASQIGTVSLTADTFSGPETGVGEVYLTEAQSPDDAAGASVRIPMAFGTFIAQGGAFLINNGNNQNLEIRDFPTNINGTDFTVTNLNMDIEGSSNGFLTNPSDCSATDGFVANSTAFDGSIAAPVNVAFQATNCAGTTPFAPTLNLTLGNPTAGQLTGITADLGIPAGQSSVKLIRTALPPSLAPNYPSFGAASDQCPTSAAPLPSSVFNETICPPQAKVGTMTITTPLLTNPLVGDVYLINQSPLPWFGVAFDQPGISVRLVGVTSLPQVDPLCDPLTEPSGFCQSQIAVLFNSVPDVPTTNVNLDLDGPDRAGGSGPLSGKLLTVAAAGSTNCAPGPARSTLLPYTGNPFVVALQQQITLNGC